MQICEACLVRLFVYAYDVFLSYTLVKMKQSPIPVCYVPEEMKDKYRKACDRQGRSMTDVTRQLVSEFVEKEEQKRRRL